MACPLWWLLCPLSAPCLQAVSGSAPVQGAKRSPDRGLYWASGVAVLGNYPKFYPTDCPRWGGKPPLCPLLAYCLGVVGVMIRAGGTTRGEKVSKFQGVGAVPVPVTPPVTPYGRQHNAQLAPVDNAI